MKKLISLLLIVFVLSGCGLKVGEEYYLVAASRISFDLDVAKKLKKAEGTKAYSTIESQYRIERAGLGTKVQLIEKHGKICEVVSSSTKVMGYTSCSSIKNKVIK